VLFVRCEHQVVFGGGRLLERCLPLPLPGSSRRQESGLASAGVTWDGFGGAPGPARRLPSRCRAGSEPRHSVDSFSVRPSPTPQQGWYAGGRTPSCLGSSSSPSSSSWMSVTLRPAKGTAESPRGALVCKKAWSSLQTSTSSTSLVVGSFTNELQRV
jgi:hypothetical protein